MLAVLAVGETEADEPVPLSDDEVGVKPVVSVEVTVTISTFESEDDDKTVGDGEDDDVGVEEPENEGGLAEAELAG